MKGDSSSKNKSDVKNEITLNDIYQNLPIETTEANLTDIYEAIHKSGAKVVAINITPSKGDKTWDLEKKNKTDQINEWIANSDADYKINAHKVVEDPTNPDYILPLYNADGLHLQQDGYYAVAEAVYKDIRVRVFSRSSLPQTLHHTKHE